MEGRGPGGIPTDVKGGQEGAWGGRASREVEAWPTGGEEEGKQRKSVYRQRRGRGGLVKTHRHAEGVGGQAGKRAKSRHQNWDQRGRQLIDDDEGEVRENQKKPGASIVRVRDRPPCTSRDHS